MTKKKYDLGVAFGGGGTRAFAHLGVIKALEEKGITPDVYSGTSAGSIVAVLLASGMNSEEVFDKMKELGMMDYAEMALPKKGLMKLSKLKKQLDKTLKEKDLKELKTPVFICATEIKKGEAVYFNKGPLSKLVQASASIPVLFSPVEYDGGEYVDGGVLDNVPVRPLRACCKKIIGISINPIEPRDKLSSLIDIATRSFQLSVNSTVNNSREWADIFLEPDGLNKFFMLDPSKANAIFELGYEYAKKQDFDL